MKERRLASRQKSFLQGRIYFNNRRATLDCVIRDLSEAGARLKMSESAAVPEAMELYIPNREEMHRARVEWRNGNEIGVSFEAASPSIAPDLGHREPRDPAQAHQAHTLTQRVQKLEDEVLTLRRAVAELRAENRKSHGEIA